MNDVLDNLENRRKRMIQKLMQYQDKRSGLSKTDFSITANAMGVFSTLFQIFDDIYTSQEEIVRLLASQEGDIQKALNPAEEDETKPTKKKKKW